MAENPRIEELRRRLEREPGSRIFAQLAEELRKAGQLPEAIRVARQGLLNHPAYPSARMTLGRALLDSRDLRGARSEFEAVLRGAPDNILASRYLADALEGLGDLGSALLQYRATLRLSPGDRNVEAQIKALEERLTPGAPPLAAPPTAPARRPELARPGVIPVLEVDGPMELETALESSPRWGTTPARDAFPASVERATESPEVAPVPVPVEPAVAASALPPALEDDFPLAGVPPASEWPGAAAPPPLPAVLAPAEFPSPDAMAPFVAEAAIADVKPATALPSPPPLPPAELPLASPDLPAGAVAQPLYSSTLAELYFQQGFTRQAIEVYEQLLVRDPANGRLQARLVELRAIDRAEDSDRSSPAMPAGDPRARRREAIGRTISRLEGFMHAVRRA